MRKEISQDIATMFVSLNQPQNSIKILLIKKNDYTNASPKIQTNYLIKTLGNINPIEKINMEKKSTRN